MSFSDRRLSVLDRDVETSVPDANIDYKQPDLHPLVALFKRWNGTIFELVPAAIDAIKGTDGLNRIAVSQELISNVEHIVTGDLTNDGIQWSTEVTSTTVDVDVVVFEAEIAKISGIKDLQDLEFGLTCALKAESATADIDFKWQIQNVDNILAGGSNWIDLFSAVAVANINTTYIEYTYSGYFAPEAYADMLPLKIRLIAQSNEAGGAGGVICKVKNSSYVRYTV